MADDGGRDHDVSLVYVVGRVDQGIRQELRTRLSEWGLTVTEFTALSVLGRRPGLSNAQLARRSLVKPQSMIQILARLESRGLVRRTVGPDHGRILRAVLTASGERLVGAAEPEVAKIQEQLFGDLPPESRELVADALFEAMARLRSRVSAADGPVS